VNLTKEIVQERTRKIRPFLKRNHTTIISLVALFIAVFGLVGQQSLIIRYERSLKALQYYDIRAELNVVFLDYSEETIPIPMIQEPEPTFHNDSTLHRWLYTFKNNNLGLDASFRTIKIRISIPSKAYNFFSGISCEWFVDSKTDVIRRDSFFESDITWGFYDAIYDISRFMWKEDVPQEIKIETTLYV